MSAPTSAGNQPGADLVREAAIQETSDILQRLKTTPEGLSQEEATVRLGTYGPNEVAQEKKHDWLARIWTAVRNPLVILLSILAIVTFATAQGQSDMVGGYVMVLMVVLGV